MKNAEQVVMSVTDLNLVADVAGPPDAPVILFLHGSGQTRQSWRRALDEAVKRGYRAVSLDLRGHGDSDWAPDGNYALERFCADVQQVIEHIGGEPLVVGASLGGLIGMMIAIASPPRIRALVLVDVTHRIEKSGAKEVIAFMDSAPDGFASVEEAVEAVSTYLPHRTRPKDASGLRRNLRIRNGRYYWHWDPKFAQLGRNADSKFQGPSPLESVARQVKIPTLLIRGRRSRVLSEEGAREFLKLVPHAEFVDIAGADHMVAGDANDAFNNAVFAFVDKQVNGRHLESTGAKSQRIAGS